MAQSGKVQQLVESGALDRLPVTFGAYCFEQMREWNLLFPAEQSYYERLLTLLGNSKQEEVDTLFGGVRAAEQRMGVDERNWPKRRFTLEQVDFLNRNPHYAEWRAAIAKVFSVIDPVLDAEVARRGHSRLVIVISPSDLPVGPDRMWLRIAERGRRVPVEPLTEFAGFAQIAAEYAHSRSVPYDNWVVDAASRIEADDKTVQLSYARLEPYRKRLMKEVNAVLRSEKITGPRELSARLKQMKILPGESRLAADPILAEFVRATLLSGNGTLLINNTFVQWATVQAVRRARPSVAIVNFGIRNKVKPFTSLLIYEDQDAVSPIPTQMDTLGSYVDLEIFYQYIWQEFEKYPEYRTNTAYLFVAEGMDEMLVIGPSDFPLKAVDKPVSASTLLGHLRSWMNLS